MATLPAVAGSSEFSRAAALGDAFSVGVALAFFVDLDDLDDAPPFLALLFVAFFGG
jgi:hypothetical protein